MIICSKRGETEYSEEGKRLAFFPKNKPDRFFCYENRVWYRRLPPYGRINEQES